jgi:hypothetical protein
VAQGGAELGLPDSVLDVGAPAEPAFDVADRLATGGSSWVGMLVTMNDTAQAWVALPSNARASWWGSMVRRRRDRGSAEICSASTRTRRPMVYVSVGQPAGA